MFRQIATVCTAVIVGSPALADGMELIENGTRDGMLGPADRFTGTVYVEPLFSDRDPFVANGARVTFLPGARSNWHAHPAGQILVVTDGAGWVQQEGGEKLRMQPGDVVWTPPGVKHWHGATETTAVTHIAIQQVKEGETVVWMEAVSDGQNSGGSQR